MEKVGFSKIKASICNIAIEAGNMCNVLPRPAFSNGLIVVKLKQYFKCKGHVYFEPVCSLVLYLALSYLVSYNQFYEDKSNPKSLLLKFKENLIKLWQNGKYMTKNVNNRKEIVFAPVEGPLNMYIIASNETTLASKIPNIVNEVNIIAMGQRKTLFQFWVMNFVKSKHFLIFFLQIHLAIMLLKIFWV